MPEITEIRWREPIFGESTVGFRCDDRVRIARLVGCITTQEIIGHVGVISEVDYEHLPGLVEMKCETCAGYHTMHEQELDYHGSDLVQFVQEKAGVATAPVEASSADALEDALALAMHKAGFTRVCVKNRPQPSGDPAVPRPLWSKHGYGVIGSRMIRLGAIGDSLIKIAREVGGYLVEWSTYSDRTGYDTPVTPRDWATLAVEMPVRALIVSQKTT